MSGHPVFQILEEAVAQIPHEGLRLLYRRQIDEKLAAFIVLLEELEEPLVGQLGFFFQAFFRPHASNSTLDQAERSLKRMKARLNSYQKLVALLRSFKQLNSQFSSAAWILGRAICALHPKGRAEIKRREAEDAA